MIVAINKEQGALTLLNTDSIQIAHVEFDAGEYVELMEWCGHEFTTYEGEGDVRDLSDEEREEEANDYTAGQFQHFVAHGWAWINSRLDVEFSHHADHGYTVNEIQKYLTGEAA